MGYSFAREICGPGSFDGNEAHTHQSSTYYIGSLQLQSPHGQLQYRPWLKHIFIPHAIGPINTPSHTARDTHSLSVSITPTPAAYSFEKDRPNAIVVKILSLRKQWKMLGLEGENNGV